MAIIRDHYNSQKKIPTLRVSYSIVFKDRIEALNHKWDVAFYELIFYGLYS
jgi:hypothetical protein